MLSRCVSTIIAAGVAAILAAPAQAQPTPADIEGKAQLCSACHGANGVPTDAKTMPNIWGQQPYYILTQLVHYRNGMREHPVMSVIAKGLQQSDLRPLAAYYAAKPWPAASSAPAAPAETPKGLTMCTPCHQANFQGGPNPVPAKAALALMGLIASDAVRAPLLPLAEADRERLAACDA